MNTRLTVNLNIRTVINWELYEKVATIRRLEGIENPSVVSSLMEELKKEINFKKTLQPEHY